MIGIEILKPVKVNLSQDTQKLKKISQKESLKDYRKDVSDLGNRYAEMRSKFANPCSPICYPFCFIQFSGIKSTKACIANKFSTTAASSIFDFVSYS